MASEPNHKLILEIEVPGFYVDGTTQQVADEFGCQIVDIVTDEWMRRDVGITFVSIPGEKEMNSDFEVHAQVAHIVGARIEPTGELAHRIGEEGFDIREALAAARALLVEADSAISHLHHRNIWPLDKSETNALIGRLRKASEA